MRDGLPGRSSPPAGKAPSPARAPSSRGGASLQGAGGLAQPPPGRPGFVRAGFDIPCRRAEIRGALSRGTGKASPLEPGLFPARPAERFRAVPARSPGPPAPAPRSRAASLSLKSYSWRFLQDSGLQVFSPGRPAIFWTLFCAQVPALSLGGQGGKLLAQGFPAGGLGVPLSFSRARSFSLQPQLRGCSRVARWLAL